MLPTTLAEARGLASSDAAKYERALVALSRSADPATARRALALLGLLQFDQKRWPDAAATLSAAAEADPMVAAWLRLRLAEAYASLGRVADAAAVDQQIASSGTTSATTVALLRLPALYAQLGNNDATATAMQQAAAIPIDELTEPDFVQLAAALEKAGRSDLANGVRMRLLTDFAQGRFTETTYRQLASGPATPFDSLSFDAAMSLAQRLAARERYDQAFDLLGRIATRFPEQVARDPFRTLRLRALFSTRKYSQLISELPAPGDSAALALLRARAAWRAGHADEFLAGLDAIEKSWPSSREATEAKVLRAKYYVTDVTDYPRSIENLKAVIAANELGNEGENLWTLGWTYVLAGRYDEALSTFDDYVRRMPDSDYTSNALFWSGKVLDKLGRAADRDARWRALIDAYPYGYYSYRARELMGTVPPFVGAATANAPASAPTAPAPNSTAATTGAASASTPPQTPAPFPDLDAQVASAADPAVDAVRELTELDLTRDASREMQRVAATHPDNLGLQFMLADLFARGGEPFKANGLLQRRFRAFVRHGGSGIPQRFWEILFPLHYWPKIQEAAAKQGVDPYILASIIRQESGFEPHVVSNAGAVGLMQIMPAEASQIAARAGLASVTRESLFDPEINIQVGAAEFGQKLAAMNGNPILAIAAYNAGTDAVGKWLAQTPPDDIDLFVEAIPYAETRLYVKTVVRNRFEYRRIYEASTPSGASP